MQIPDATLIRLQMCLQDYQRDANKIADLAMLTAQDLGYLILEVKNLQKVTTQETKCEVLDDELSEAME